MSSVSRYHVRHDTLYRYGAEVRHSQQLFHLVPRPSAYQQCLEHTLHLVPEPTYRSQSLDAFGNPVTRVEFEAPHRELRVTSELQVEVYGRPAVPADASHAWERVAGALAYHGPRPGQTDLEVCRFRFESPYVRVQHAFTDFGAACFAAGRPVLSCASDLMHTLYRELRYAPGQTSVATPLTEVLAKRHGVCQDFAHLMIACLRSRGLAARYVSGYVRVPTGDEAQGAPLRGAGASHAWVAVYSPPFGWIELDPTNDCWVGSEHVAVAWGRDFGDVSPVRGIILGGGSHELAVDVTVEPGAHI